MRVNFLHYDLPVYDDISGIHWKLDKKGNPIHGKATVCIRENNDFYEVGVAFCSPEDNFSKEIGRILSNLSLLEGPDTQLYMRIYKSLDSNNQPTQEDIFAIGKAAIVYILIVLEISQEIKTLKQMAITYSKWHCWVNIKDIIPRGRNRKKRIS